MALIQKVNRRLEKLGRPERLVYNPAGGGYYYFIEGDSSRWYSSSIHVSNLDRAYAENGGVDGVLSEMVALSRCGDGGAATEEGIEPSSLGLNW
jgi:hypothetical protein